MSDCFPPGPQPILSFVALFAEVHKVETGAGSRGSKPLVTRTAQAHWASGSAGRSTPNEAIGLREKDI